MGTSAALTLNERSYRLYVPTGIPANAPLVVSCHPGASNALFWEGGPQQLNSTLDTAADSGLFYVAYPAGNQFPPGSDTRTWNAGWCCGYSYQTSANDVGFLKLLISQLQLDYSINSSKVFLSGYSNGSFLCLSYMCQYPSTIAGVVTAAAALVLDHDFAVSSINLPWTNIYGSLDTNVNPAGGFGPDSGAYYPPLAQTVSFLQSKGCTVTLMELFGATHAFPTIQYYLGLQEGTSYAQVIANMVAA